MTGHTSPEIPLHPRLSRAYLVHQRVCPVGDDGSGALTIAHGAEHSARALANIAGLYGQPYATRCLPDHDLDQLIERVTTAAGHSHGGAEHDVDDLALEDVRQLANQPPVIRYVNFLVREAFEAGASDIHLEATRHGLDARIRLDGILQPAPVPARELGMAVVSRLKAMAALDVTERRRPQDGRIRVLLEARELDLRLSTVPTVHGESVVLRLLDQGGRPVQLSELGMPEWARTPVVRTAARPHGMLLVTGPTGSGKTTSLYAALLARPTAREKVITVEDPVEYHLDSVVQVPVHRAAGTTFANVLRAILRQDPDVVMVGEMRDAETAAIAVQAAMTGHLVLSTLHTNDAIGAIARLVDLGVPAYAIAATVELIVAQRLLRKLCDACRARDAASGTWHPVGCPHCRSTGYRGRTGVFEAIPMTEPLRRAVAAGSDATVLRQIAQDSGLVPLREHGLALARDGVTSLEEVLRVVES